MKRLGYFILIGMVGFAFSLRGEEEWEQWEDAEQSVVELESISDQEVGEEMPPLEESGIKPMMEANQTLLSLSLPTECRVLLGSALDSAFVELTGRYRIMDPNKQELLSTRYFGKGYLMHPFEEGIKWGEVFVDTYQIELIPDRGSHFLVNGTQYSGSLLAYVVDGALALINRLPIEDYLLYTLSHDDVSLDEKALRAMVIAARTDVAFQVHQLQQQFWNLPQSDYVLYGATAFSRTIEQALHETAGQVLIYDGMVFPSQWTAHSAGKTADYAKIFHRTENGPLEGKVLPLAEQDRFNTSWNFFISQRELSDKLEMNAIENIALYADRDSKRVYGVRFSSQEKDKRLSFKELQQLFGKDQIVSNLFEVNFEEKNVVFSGFGKGMGVGLCLYTANELAKEGQSTDAILTHFFEDTHLATLNG